MSSCELTMPEPFSVEVKTAFGSMPHSKATSILQNLSFLIDFLPVTCSTERRRHSEKTMRMITPLNVIIFFIILGGLMNNLDDCLQQANWELTMSQVMKLKAKKLSHKSQNTTSTFTASPKSIIIWSSKQASYLSLHILHLAKKSKNVPYTY